VINTSDVVRTTRDYGYDLTGPRYSLLSVRTVRNVLYNSMLYAAE